MCVTDRHDMTLAVNRGVKPQYNQPTKSSELKDFADDRFKFDENGRKLSKRVENTVGKGEIARDEQFLLFPQCFQKACVPGVSKVSLCGNGLNCNTYKQTYLHFRS